MQIIADIVDTRVANQHCGQPTHTKQSVYFTAEQARDTLAGLGTAKSYEKLLEYSEGAVAKPYLHALPKEVLRPLAYEKVIESTGPFPTRLGSLYLHFPFCTKNCTYCHYYKTTAGSNSDWQEYPKVLTKELNTLCREFGIEKISADTIHFGGGSPSLIGHEAWMNMMLSLSDRVDLNKVREIAIEVDPVDFHKEQLDFWCETGVNRISLGVQSFDPEVLAILKRNHSFEQVLSAYEMMVRSDICNINIDLMYGMPGRSVTSWHNDLKQVLALRPLSLTCYATRPNEINDFSSIRHFPLQEERILMHQMAIEMLLDAGYIHYSPNQFILGYEGICLAKNNRNRCLDVLGIGPHAHSIFQGWFYENNVNVKKYREIIDEGGLCELRGARIDDAEAKRRYLQFGIKLSGLNKPLLDNGVWFDDYNLHFGSSVEDDFSGPLSLLLEMGLIEPLNGGNIRLNSRGVLMSQEIAKLISLSVIEGEAHG